MLPIPTFLTTFPLSLTSGPACQLLLLAMHTRGDRGEAAGEGQPGRVAGDVLAHTAPAEPLAPLQRSSHPHGRQRRSRHCRGKAGESCSPSAGSGAPHAHPPVRLEVEGSRPQARTVTEGSRPPARPAAEPLAPQVRPAALTKMEAATGGEERVSCRRGGGEGVRKMRQAGAVGEEHRRWKRGPGRESEALRHGWEKIRTNRYVCNQWHGGYFVTKSH
jgi:hypothetical protein